MTKRTFDGVGLDYFRCSVFADYEVVLRSLVTAHGVGPVSAVRGHHGYGLGCSIPTSDRGTLQILSPGQHEWPSVRVSGWPTDSVVQTLRQKFEGQASRVDARFDFVGRLDDWTEVLRDYARAHAMKHAAYFVGTVSTGLQVGSGSSESLTRCYDADLKHPGEFDGPTQRLEHEWKPQTRERKVVAYSVDAPTVLGTSRAAATVLEKLAGLVFPAAPVRTERTADFMRWLEYINRQQDRLSELLQYTGGDMGLAMSWMLDPSLAYKASGDRS